MNYLNEPLYRAILSDPECDTARLVFADWLDEKAAENPVDVVCPNSHTLGYNPRYMGNCGFDCAPGQIRVNSGKQYRYGEPRTKNCNVCNGVGTIRDTSFRDRAEFIRLEIARSCGQCEECGGTDLKVGPCGLTNYYRDCLSCKVNRLRIDELLTANPEWLKQECPACGKTNEAILCHTCNRTKDLLVANYGGPPWEFVSRNPILRRGFVDEVSCTLEEIAVRQCRGCGGTCRFGEEYVPCRCHYVVHPSDPNKVIPSPWALAVVRTLPITRFRITDKSAFEFDSGRWVYSMEELHSFLQNPEAADIHSTREAAHDALATAAATWARKHAFPKETKL